MYKILLSGYYGYNNAGDEAILSSIISNIREINKDAKITVFSDNINFTKDKYHINAVNRFNIFSIIKEIITSDILISGGGTLFQDKTSTRSLIYYTTIINLGKLFGKKIMIYANGIGPIEKKINLKRVKRAIENTNLVTLRDKEAFEIVEKMDLKNKNVFLTVDPVFSLTEESKEKVERILRHHEIYDKEFITISIREFQKSSKIKDILPEILEYIIKKYNKKIIFLPLQYPNDVDFSNSIVETMDLNLRKNIFIIKNLNPREMMGVIKEGKYIISMRLHGLIFAANVKIPGIGISYDPKVDNFLEEFKDNNSKINLKLEDLTVDNLKLSIDDMEKNYSKYKEKMEKKQKEFKEKAKKNYEYMAKIINE